MRSAPSTKAIIRSIKPFPDSAVTRIISSSEIMRVPPVTELATSEPDSLRTGADSPVMADSSTDATPMMTSPSAGIISPETTYIVSPGCKLLALTSVILPSTVIVLAIVADWVERKVSAWAFPRPSATASAKLLNKTVNNKITVNSPLKR